MLRRSSVMALTWLALKRRRRLTRRLTSGLFTRPPSRARSTGLEVLAYGPTMRLSSPAASSELKIMVHSASWSKFVTLRLTCLSKALKSAILAPNWATTARTMVGSYLTRLRCLGPTCSAGSLTFIKTENLSLVVTLRRSTKPWLRSDTRSWQLQAQESEMP